VSLLGEVLRFTSVSVGTNSLATLEVSGPTNLTCVLERAGWSSSFIWESVTNYTLSSSGSASLSASLFGNTNAVFRTRSTYDTYYSTNAAGVLIGYCRDRYELIGNPFGPISNFTEILPSPLNGLSVYLWNGTGYDGYDYVDGDWSSTANIGPLEGFFIRNTSTNQTQRYVIANLYSTNSVILSIGTNNALLCSQQFWPLITNSTPTRVDLLQTNRLGGYTGLPVQGISTNTWTQIQRWDWNSQAYTVHSLTNGVWRVGTNQTDVPLSYGEGFFFRTGTNSTWTANRSIWP
jgi:hypothetical protein